MKKFFALVLALVMALSLTTVAWGVDPVEVSDEAGLVAAFEKGGTYKLTKSVAVAENTRFVVGKGVSVTLDLGGNTLSSTNTETKTHNFFIDVNGGTLTISNGAVEYTHTGTNMGWNGATTAIDVTGGGILNMSDVSVTVSGTDMNFAVHMNNWGSVTFDADNCVFDATYCGVRVFNSGPDMNDVTIKNSTLKGGSRAFWVHNYASSDMGGKLWSSSKETYDESKVLARLDLDIYNNNNTFEITGTAKSPIRYGFNEAVYFTERGVRVTDVAEPSAPVVAPSDELNETQKELVENVGTSFDTAANEALGAAASAVVDNNPVSADDVAEALADAGVTGAVEEFDIVVESSFDVEITDVVADNGDVDSITLDITPVYQMVATNGTDDVVLAEGELEIEEPVVITVNIPDSLATQAVNGKLYVTHEAATGTYVYEATVGGFDGAYTATFTNPHGFSPFTISAGNPTVAVVNGVNYANLQDAVDAADDGSTVKLLKNSKANIKVGKNVTIDPNGHKYTGKVTAKTGYQLFKNSSGNYVITAVATKGDTFDLYLADDGMKAALKAKTPSVAGLSFKEVGAHTNQDGSGNVAYIVANSGDYYVKTTTPYTTSYAVTYAGKTDVLYYVNLGSAGAGYYAYEEEVTAFDKFSTYDKCGYVTVQQMPAATDVYFETEDGDVYKAYTKVTAGAVNYLLNGKIVSADAKQTVVDHKFVASGYKYDTTYKVNVPTSALCTKCLMTSTTIYKDGKVPAGLKFYELYEGNTETGYSVVAEASAPSVGGTTGGKVESAETFDAGIAMYVGMSVMAAAGAVVLKKRED